MEQRIQKDEEQLIARSQRGEVDAFNQLVLHYQSLMYTTVFRMLGDYDIAADITQDAFLAAFRAIKSFRGGSSFRAWLLRIGTNLVCDHWRRLQRHRIESLDALTEEDEPHGPNLLDILTTTGTEDNPEEHALTLELQECIQNGLRELSLEQRVAIVLCDIQGLSYEEVAQATQTTLGTVRSRISRARARLRDYLSRHKELLPRQYRLTSNTDS